MNCKNTYSTHILQRLLAYLKIWSLSLALFTTANVDADGWALFSQQAQMKGYFIAEVGDVSAVEPPFNTEWENDVYQMNDRCFSFSEYNGYSGYGNKAALLLVNAQKDVKLALIESSIGSIKTELKSVTMLACPAGTNVIPQSDDLEQQLRHLQKQRDEMKRMLEELKK